MVRHRALLIGAGDYEMRGVSPLPFIPGDLARLGAALEARGFDEVQVLAGREGGKQVSANYVNARVTGFLRRARLDDTLLILLSGHGVHAKGRDYLVPEDIDEDTHPFVSGCVPIDWREQLDETLATHVVFLIDACREGIEQDSMGVAAVKQWSRQKVSAALRRKVAYVYACSPGQYALFVRPHDSAVDPVAGVRPGESFSIFSRSLSDVLATHPPAAALNLGEFQDAVQDRMTELHRAYRKSGQPQSLRVITDIPSDGFGFLPPPPPPSSPPSPRAWSARGTEPSAVRAGDDTAPFEGAAMGVVAGTSQPAHPRHPLGPGDRLFTALTALGVLGVLGVLYWSGITYGGNDKSGGRASDKAGTGASVTPSSSRTGPSSTSAKKSEGGSGSGVGEDATIPAGSTLPNCTASTVKLSVRSLHNQYPLGKTPTLLLTAMNSSGSDCKIDLGPKNAMLTITRADSNDAYWSSADCPKGSGSLLFRAPAGNSITYTVKWDRSQSIPKCATPSVSPSPPGWARAGTYLVEATAPGFTKAQTSFVLDK